MHQPSLNDSTLLHFDLMILDIPCDTGRREEFQRLCGHDGTNNDAVDHDMTDGDGALDAGFLADHQGPVATALAADIAAHFAVDTQSSLEDHVPFDTRSRADETIDTVLRQAFLF